jgi:tetratricopeptide (TPR) repeat protein
MHHAVRNLVATLVLIFLFMPAQRAAQLVRKKVPQSSATEADTVAPQTNSMTIWQARKVVVEILQTSDPTRGMHGKASEVILLPGRLNYRDSGGLPCSIPLDLRTPGGFRIADFNKKGYQNYYYLVRDGYRNEEDTGFSTAAKAWRENPVKPALSPEADRHRILAENAIKEKNIDSAIEHFESGLELQPMWPAGWFNLAIIYAEQNNFADATDRMKHYLELVPDAPDAKDAREQMIIWEDKAKR